MHYEEDYEVVLAMQAKGTPGNIQIFEPVSLHERQFAFINLRQLQTKIGQAQPVITNPIKGSNHEDNFDYWLF